MRLIWEWSVHGQESGDLQASLSDTVIAGVKASEKAFMFLLASSFPAGLLRYLCPAD
jgi:hypothetical protein